MKNIVHSNEFYILNVYLYTLNNYKISWMAIYPISKE